MPLPQLCYASHFVVFHDCNAAVRSLQVDVDEAVLAAIIPDRWDDDDVR